MTPLATDGHLYTCVDLNVVLALGPDTGKGLWRFDPQVNTEGSYGTTCRGVSHFESPRPLAQCQRRILFGVADGRLMAVDADSGKRCTEFGTNGTVDLRVGMGCRTSASHGLAARRGELHAQYAECVDRVQRR
jgi:glucose dehydrogenase